MEQGRFICWCQVYSCKHMCLAPGAIILSANIITKHTATLKKRNQLFEMVGLGRESIITWSPKIINFYAQYRSVLTICWKDWKKCVLPHIIHQHHLCSYFRKEKNIQLIIYLIYSCDLFHIILPQERDSKQVTMARIWSAIMECKCTTEKVLHNCYRNLLLLVT